MKQEKNNSIVRLPAAGDKQPELKPASSNTQADKRHNRRRLLVGLALVFFLFCVIFIIPVGHIPVLRNLSWLMGFSAQDTQSMSFFRTLLTWAGDADCRHLSGSWYGNEEYSLFNRNQQPGFNASGPKSGLFDLRAVNAARRAKGLSPDGLYGAYSANGQQDGAAVNGTVNGWSQAAKAATAAKNAEEVYFGTDADVAVRAAAEDITVKGSSNTAWLVKSGNIAGAASVDWLGLAVDKASLLTNSQLDGALKDASQIPSPLSNLSGSLTAGDKPQRDLATVWLLSKAANRAQYLMLKKQLASAGYMAMEIPKKVYDSSGAGTGIGLTGDETIGDFKDVNQQLLTEQQCRDLTTEANSNLAPKLDEAKGLVQQIRGSVPRSCGDGIQTWKEDLIKVQTNCRDVKEIFGNMKMACGVKLVSEGRCETVRLDSYASDLEAACDALAQAQAAGATEEEIAALEAARDEVIDGLTDEEVFNSFNVSDSSGEEAGSNDFFPVTEENTSWLSM